jgi:hypothetical protein
MEAEKAALFASPTLSNPADERPIVTTATRQTRGST